MSKPDDFDIPTHMTHPEEAEYCVRLYWYTTIITDISLHIPLFFNWDLDDESGKVSNNTGGV